MYILKKTKSKGKNGYDLILRNYINTINYNAILLISH
jgi:hypothetical protein